MLFCEYLLTYKYLRISLVYLIDTQLIKPTAIKLQVGLINCVSIKLQYSEKN